jgi:hypothetical protein
MHARQRFHFFGLALSAALLFGGSAAKADVIAYDNAAVPSTQNYTGSLGLDFNVNAPITITQLGVFDSGSTANLVGSNGSSGVYVAIYNRATGKAVSAGYTLTPSSAVTQVNGDAFIHISPVALPAGFQGSVVTINAKNTNTFGSPNTASTLNDGGGLISFVGSGRYGGNGYPTNLDSGPANRYSAGTFEFVSSALPPTLTTFSSRSAFNAATLGQTVTTFDGLANGSQTFIPSGSYSANGVTFSGALDTGSALFNNLFFADGVFAGHGPGSSNNDVLFLPGNSLPNFVGVTTITLPPGTTAAGFDYAGSFRAVPLQVFFPSGAEVNLTAPEADPNNGPATYGFFGFTSSTPISQLTIVTAGNNDNSMIDNFTTAQVIPPTFPEPSSLALCGLAGLGLVGWRRWRKRAAS